MQPNDLMEKLKRKYAHEANCTKILNQQNCMLMKKSITLSSKKKTAYFKEQLKENTATLKNLWKTLRQLDLPEKRLPCTDICLKAEEELRFDPFSELFKKFYFNLANDLVQKLPAAIGKKFDIEIMMSVILSRI